MWIQLLVYLFCLLCIMAFMLLGYSIGNRKGDLPVTRKPPKKPTGKGAAIVKPISAEKLRKRNTVEGETEDVMADTFRKLGIKP